MELLNNVLEDKNMKRIILSSLLSCTIAQIFGAANPAAEPQGPVQPRVLSLQGLASRAMVSAAIEHQTALTLGHEERLMHPIRFAAARDAAISRIQETAGLITDVPIEIEGDGMTIEQHMASLRAQNAQQPWFTFPQAAGACAVVGVTGYLMHALTPSGRYEGKALLDRYLLSAHAGSGFSMMCSILVMPCGERLVSEGFCKSFFMTSWVLACTSGLLACTSLLANLINRSTFNV